MLACPELPLDPPDVRATLEEPGREGVPGGVIRPVGQLGAAEQRLPDLLEEEGVPDRLRERWARLDPPVFAVRRGRDRHRPLMVRCSAVAASTSRGPSSWLKYSDGAPSPCGWRLCRWSTSGRQPGWGRAASSSRSTTGSSHAGDHESARWRRVTASHANLPRQGIDYESSQRTSARQEPCCPSSR
jgi:hypothetical protein